MKLYLFHFKNVLQSEPLRESLSVTNSMVVPAYNYSCSRHGYCITYQSCTSFINKLYLLSLTACKKSSDSKGILLKEDVKLQNRHSEPLPDTDRNFAGKSEREKYQESILHRQFVLRHMPKRVPKSIPSRKQ